MDKGLKGSLNKWDYERRGRSSPWRGVHLSKKIKTKASWEVVWNIEGFFFLFKKGLFINSLLKVFYSPEVHITMVQKEKLRGRPMISKMPHHHIAVGASE